MGGMVLETNMTEIIMRVEEQKKLEKQEVSTDCMFVQKKINFLFLF